MAKLEFGSEVSLNEGVSLLTTCGESNWFHFEGEPGLGKSAMLGMVQEQMGDDFIPCYLDVSQMDLGDLTMPKVVEEQGTWVTRYAPNARFGIQNKGKKLIIMADELTKGSKPVVMMLLPLGLERRLGSVPLPEGSIFFSTGNLSTDGLGDVLLGHGRSRISTVKVKKPICWDHDASGTSHLTEWGIWAANNNVPAVLLAWAKENPQAFASYTDPTQADNPFIYNPKLQQRSYVCNRSLTKAGHIIHQRAKFSDNAFTCALSGTVGEAAARSMESYFALSDKLPSTESILKSPKTAMIPDSGAGMCMVTLNLLMAAKRENMDNIMEYISRLRKEAAALFCISVMKSDKRSVAANNKSFTSWALQNQYVFA